MNGWIEVCSKLYVGEMRRVFVGEFDAVLAVSPSAPRTSDSVKHRWITADSPQAVLEAGQAWLAPRWLAGQKVLVQSFPSVWADLAAGACLMHLGATAAEAITLLRLAHPRLALYEDELLQYLEGR